MLEIGYVRVSTGQQAEEGVSLAAKAAKVRAMATVQGAELLEMIIDGGESAKSMNRPGLKRALDMVTAGKVQAMIVAKLDRLTRSVKDLCELLELGQNAQKHPKTLSKRLTSRRADMTLRVGHITRLKSKV